MASYRCSSGLPVCDLLSGFPMFSVILVTLATDARTRAAVSTFDQDLLKRVFMDTQKHFQGDQHGTIHYDRDSIFPEDPRQRTNRRYKLAFSDGKLEIFVFHFWSLGDFYIEFLPPTVKELVVTQCGQKYPLSTRRLPRASRSVNLSRNSLSGSLDLTRLPCEIEKFDVSSNKFSGEISLYYLPDTLQTLDASRNSLGPSLLKYGEIPSSVKHIYLMWTGVSKIEAIEKKFTETGEKVIQLGSTEDGMLVWQ
uniref:Uncharacterized protein n=1 Tax=Paramoeba aestuarina TaxID=180227 RepID=A0A7S4NND6_9EUKA|mmetsp:Transcript_21808/g.33893  ORF Transcript_21808/g.33893 Transcript_21808/m.33893 type:complete len:252 (+) Transcript_21808:47-802(+)